MIFEPCWPVSSVELTAPPGRNTSTGFPVWETGFLKRSSTYLVVSATIFFYILGDGKKNTSTGFPVWEAVFPSILHFYLIWSWKRADFPVWGERFLFDFTFLSDFCRDRACFPVWEERFLSDFSFLHILSWGKPIIFSILADGKRVTVLWQSKGWSLIITLHIIVLGGSGWTSYIFT